MCRNPPGLSYPGRTRGLSPYGQRTLPPTLRVDALRLLHRYAVERVDRATLGFGRRRNDANLDRTEPGPRTCPRTNKRWQPPLRRFLRRDAQSPPITSSRVAPRPSTGCREWAGLPGLRRVQALPHPQLRWLVPTPKGGPYLPDREG